ADEPKITRYELPPAKMRTIANPLPDALLSLKTLPGVFSGNDQSTFYNVRGGNYDENLIYLNGVEIYQPLLVRKGIAENPSLVNPYLIKSINLRTGAFPVNYGDKLSSVLDISYQDDNQEKISGIAGLSIIMANIALSGRMSEKWNWFLGVRKVNYGYLFDALQTEGTYTPDFKDIQLGATWRPDSLKQLKIFGLYGDSKFDSTPRVWSSSSYPSDPTVIHSMYLQGSESFSYHSGAIGIQWDQHFSDELQVHAGVSSFNQWEDENSYLEYYAGTSTLDSIFWVPDTFTNSSPSRIESFDNDLDISLTRFFLHSKYHFNRNHQLRCGAELKHFRFADRLHQIVEDNTPDATDPEKPVISSDQIRGTGLSMYGEYNWQPSALLSITTGLRFTRYNFNNENLLMPRFSILYRFSERTDIFLAAGRYTQPPLYKEFRSRGEQQSSNLKAQKSNQMTLGFEHQWAGNMSFRTEAYYKRLYDLISYDVWDVRIVYSGVNDAIGYVYGLDAHLRGDFIPDCLAWISYSYMVAREDLNFDAQKWVPRPSDQRHTFAASLQDKMVRFPGSRIHIRLLFGSGYHYTYYYSNINEDGEIVLEAGKRNAQKIPYYSRFDIGFSQKFTLFNSTTITLREEILNLFEYNNVLGYSWISGMMAVHNLSGRTFNIGMRVEF
ncbi:TonB-dependent receptor plug domain-containing protein, partial [candidate division KSB1 bacterium]|nr:TonB-dependent receptor plug domain-containing protein [candidate division KSB1 bacterium]